MSMPTEERDQTVQAEKPDKKLPKADLETAQSAVAAVAEKVTAEIVEQDAVAQIRAKHAQEAEEGVEVVADDAVEVYDKYDERHIKFLLEKIPVDIRFKHSPRFTDEENMIIASSLALRTPLYKIARQIRCTRQGLEKHIHNTPVLEGLYQEWKIIEKEDIEEAINECVARRVPAVIMWKAEKILPEKYGDKRGEDEEEEEHIFFGDINEESLAEADRLLAEAASKPPEAGLSAMLDAKLKAEIEAKAKGADEEALAGASVYDPNKTVTEMEREKEMVRAGAEVSPLPLNETLPAPALKPGNDPNYMLMDGNGRNSVNTVDVDDGEYVDDGYDDGYLDDGF